MKTKRFFFIKIIKELIISSIFLTFTFNVGAQYYENTKIRSQKPEIKFEKNDTVFENRNITAIGYQIGGLSLIGLNYEIRTSDYFGIHFGFGFKGVTAGVKVHTNPKRNSPFINFSLKDGGFGHITTAGVEFGGRIPFNKDYNSFGLHVQFGVGAILSISDEMEKALYGTEPAPSVTLTMGIGVSW